MPIMAAHNEQLSNYPSPATSIFINNASYSPESPTSTNSRKRKQEQQQELQYNHLNQQSSTSNGVLDTIYQSYDQTWGGNHQGNNNFIIPVTSSTSNTTIVAPLYSNSEDNNLLINKSSQMMNDSWHRSASSSTTNDPFLVNTASYDNHHQEAFIVNPPKSGDGVGENTDIHRILNLDQPQQHPFNFIDDSKGTATISSARNLHLHDLGSQRLIHQQAWSPQQQQPFNTGPNSPGFFTPGFLESLQEDESESPQSFPFHVGTASTSSSSTAKNWNYQHSEDCTSKTAITMEHGTIMTPEGALVSQQQQQPNEAPPLALFHSGPSSPIPSSSSPSSYSPPPYVGHKIASSSSTPINEDVGIMDHRRTLQVGVMNARLLQNAVNAAKMRPIIRDYLSCIGDEKTVVILTSKVAQKSYGTEKRFLCPPPTAILVGTSWWTKNNGQQVDNPNEVLKRGQDELNPPKLTVGISGETPTSQTGQIEWFTVSGTTVGQTGHNKSQQQPSQSNLQQSEHPSRFRSSSESRSNSIDWYHNHHQELLSAGKCVSKHLFINDADEKRKRVECMIKIQLANGFPLGTFASKGIKVISKPSKKRQSVKNMELCIHHGTTVSLFNRIRSQTVSTKYLGVSTAGGSPFAFPGQVRTENITAASEGTCFVARTTCWDPFVIWIVDITRSPGDAKETDTPEDYIGRNSAHMRNIPYPPPPAIALKNKTGQLIPIHYNQHVVLQCLTTGLVSPVMIIRKVDKASTVVGGAQSTDDLNLLGGGEYGDEVLGDPVSQLHKVALQIVQDPSNASHHRSQQQQQQQHQYDHYGRPSSPAPPNMMPRTSSPVTYLACLNDMVGMHKTTDPRKPINPPASPHPNPTTSSSSASSGMNWDISDMFDVTAQEEKIIRKRRVSGAAPSLTNSTDHNAMLAMQQRYNCNSTGDDYYYSAMMPPPPSAIINQPQQKFIDNVRKSSVSSTGSNGSGGRRSSVSNNGSNNQSLGAYWNEDVSDAAVWTIVGTDCATYTFLSPSSSSFLSSEDISNIPSLHNPFPSLTSFTTKPSKDEEFVLSLHGENFSRDIQVWFGDQKAIQTVYRSRELLICKVPPRNTLLETKSLYNEIPILLVRGDGTICKTNKFYPL